MKSVWLVAKRELGAVVRSPMGFLVAALVLVVDGLLFNAFALSGGEKLSTVVLNEFFFYLSGVTMVASVPISMRLLAEERQKGTIPLLLTSPIRDNQIILGKFLGACLFLFLLTLITIYMPLMIMVHGKISWGHLFSGYLGILLLGSASLAIGTFGSSLAKSQIVAVFITIFLLAVMVSLWMLAKISENPIRDIFSYLALHNMHFSTFRAGKIHLRDVVYYLSVSTFFLFLATRILESRRWR